MGRFLGAPGTGMIGSWRSLVAFLARTANKAQRRTRASLANWASSEAVPAWSRDTIQGANARRKQPARQERRQVLSWAVARALKSVSNRGQSRWLGQPIEALETRQFLSGNGLYAAYYGDTTLTTLKVDRVDTQINNNWGTTGPDPSVGGTNFSARWLGKIDVPTAGSYTFYTNATDGERLSIDGADYCINDWTSSATERNANVILTAGKHDVRLEYYDGTDNATASLSWAGPDIAKQIIPQSQLYTNVMLQAPQTAKTGDSIVLASVLADSREAVDSYTYQWSISLGGTVYGSGTGSQVNFMPNTSGTYTVALTATKGGYATVLRQNIAVTGTNLAQIVDDNQSGFTQSAGWTDLASGLNGHSYYSATLNNTASWTFNNIDPGQYRIAVTYPVGSTSNPAVAYTVQDGTTTIDTVTVNQQVTSTDYIYQGVAWQYLGGIKSVTGNSLTVALTVNNSGYYTLADAVRLERVGTLSSTADIQVVDSTGSALPWGSSTINVGMTTVGGAALTRTLTVRNTGTQNLLLGTITLPAGFSVSSGPGTTTLTPGATTTFTVQLNATTAGTPAGTLSIASNASSAPSYSVTLSGTVASAITGVVDNATAGSFTATGSWTTSTYSSSFYNGTIAYTLNSGSTATWTFTGLTAGKYRVAATYTTSASYNNNVPVTIKDNGTVIDYVTVNQQIVPSDFVYNGSYFKYLGGVQSVTSSTLSVTFTANSASLYTMADAVRLERVDSLSSTADIQVIDTPTGSALPSGTGTINVGTATVGGSAVPHTLTIRNTGTQNLLLGTITLPAGFSVSSGPGTTTLTPGATTTFTVQLNATTAGAPSGTLSIASNASSAPSYGVTLAGTVNSSGYVVVDDSTAGSFTKTGTWPVSYAGTLYNGEEAYNNVVGNTATWTFTGLAAGKYRVAATYSESGTFNNNVPVTLKDGTTVVDYVYVNQQVAPTDFTYNNCGFKYLGGIQSVTSGTLSLTLTSNSASLYTIADAVRLERVGDLSSTADMQVIDTPTGSALPSGTGTINLGTTTVGGSAVSHTLTIRNTGSAALNLGTITAPTGFSVSSGPGTTTLTPGATTTFTVQLNATTAGTPAGTLSIASNASSAPSYNVTLAGTVNSAIIKVIDDSAVDGSFTKTGTWPLGYAATVYAGEEACNNVVGSTAIWTFGGLPAGRYRVAASHNALSTFNNSAPLTIKDGTTVIDYVIDNQQVTPADFSVGSCWFKYLGGIQSVTTGSLSVTVTSNSTSLYTVADAMRLERVGDLATTADMQVIDTATGSALPPGTGSVNLGSMTVGTAPLQHTLTIRNTGTQNLLLGTITPPTGFSISSGPGTTTLTPGSTTTFTVQLNGASAGAPSGTLSIASNASSAPSYNVTLAGTVNAEASTTIDNGGNGSLTTGTWTPAAIGYQGNCIYDSTVGDTATWTFHDLPAGSYRVSATYTPSATLVPVSILGGDGSLLATATINEQITPNDAQYGGVGWKYLTTAVTPINGILVIRMAVTSGTPVADGMRLERMGQAGMTAAPLNAAAVTSSTSQIDLTWSASSGTVFGYNVYRGTTAAGESATPINGGTLITSASYSDNTGLVPGTQYYYRIQAVGPGGASANSNEASAYTQAAAPTNVSAFAVSTTQIGLTWTAAVGATLGYNVYRGTTPGGESSVMIGWTSTTSYSDASGLNPGTQYYYTLRAVGGAGLGAVSTEAAANTLPVALANPLGQDAATTAVLNAFQYVYNNIAYEPYAGSLKSPASTDATQSGNDWDQAALLISKLQAAGITAQFANGQIIPNQGDLLNWLGVKDVDAAYETLLNTFTNYFSRTQAASYVAKTTGFDGLETVTFFHVWVQVQLVPNGPWNNLDPSWKYKDYNDSQLGIDVRTAVPYAPTQAGGYYTLAPTNELPLQWYQDQVSQYLRNNAPGVSVADVVHDGPIIAKRFSLMPAELPYAYYTPTNYFTIPTYFRGRLDVSVKAGTTQILDYTIDVTTSGTINASCPIVLTYNTDGGYVTPVLQINGQTVATAIQGVPYNSSIAITLDQIGLWQNGVSDTTDMRHTYERNAGQVLGIGVDAGQWSEAEILAMQSQLNQQALAVAAGTATAGSYQSLMVGFAAAKYFAELDHDTKAITALMDLSWVRSGMGFGLVTADALTGTSADYHWDAQYPIFSNIATDIGNALNCWALPLQGGFDLTQSYLNQTYTLFMDQSSGLEHNIVQEMLNRDGISTIRGLQLANSHGYGLVILTPGANHAANELLVTTNLPRLTAQHTELVSELDQGFTIIAANTEIVGPDNTRLPYPTIDPAQANSWEGTTWIKEKFTQHGLAIGMLIAQDGQPAHGGTPAGNYVPTSSTQPLDIAHATTYTVADPVNPYNGNLVHDETDITQPNTGLALNFSRHYDTLLTQTVQDGTVALAPVDQGMGLGWTYSFGDTLTIGAGESYVDWATSTGERHKFTPNGSGGYTNAPGVYGKLTKLTVSGIVSYEYREVDGTTYHFDLVNAAAARLGWMTDRNNNKLQLDYNLTTGTLTRVYDTQAAATRVLAFTWDANKHITGITDGAGRHWSYTYTSTVINSVTQYLLQQMSAPYDGHTVQSMRYAYHTETPLLGLLQSITDATNAVYTFDYYTNKRVFCVTDPLGNQERYEYDLWHNITRYTDERGLTTTYEFDKNGLTTRIIHPDQTRVTNTWNSADQLTSSIDELGRVNSYSYNGLGNVTSQTSKHYAPTSGNPYTEDQVTTAYIYDTSSQGFDRLTQMTVQDSVTGNRVTTYGYDSHGNVTSVTDPLGNATSMTYDSRGRLLTQTTPKGNVAQPDGNYTTTYTYNDAGQVLTVKNGLSSTLNITTNTYDPQGDLLSTTDGTGRTTSYVYDVLGELLQTILPSPDPAHPNGLVSFATYTAGLLVATTDARGLITQYFYDADRRLLRTVYADGSAIVNTYDRLGNLSSVTDALGRTTRYLYDANNRRIQSLNPDGSMVLVRYDAGGRALATATPASTVTPYGRDAVNVTTATYDAGGRTLTATDALGYQTQFFYDELGELTAQNQVSSPPAGSATSYQAVGTGDFSGDGKVDVLYRDLATGNLAVSVLGGSKTVWLSGNPTFTANLLVADLNADGKADVYGQDSLGNWWTATSTGSGFSVQNQGTNWTPPAGTTWLDLHAGDRSTHYTYDKDGRVIQKIGPAGQVSTVHYDANGNVDKTVSYDVSGLTTLPADVTTLATNRQRITTLTYDVANRPIQQTDPLLQTTSTTYDLAGRALTTTDAKLNVTTSTYDPVGRWATTTGPDPDGNGPLAAPVTQYTYDEDGNVRTATDADNHLTSYRYDAKNRRIGVTDALGHTSFTYYDGAGQVVMQTDALGNTTVDSYDLRGRLIQETKADPDGGGPQTAPVTSFTYDAAGNLTQMTDARGNVTTNVYDAVGHLVQSTGPDPDGTGPQAAPVTHALYAFGNKVETTDADGNTTDYIYDAAGRVRQQIESAPTAGSVQPMTRETYDSFGNLASQADPSGHTTLYGYDALNRQTQVTNALGATLGAAGATTTTVYDAVGNKLSVTDPLGHTTSYGYDNLNRHISVTQPDPDGAGPLPAPITTYSYDAAGNLLSQIDPLGNTTRYGYDALNRQTQVTDALGATLGAAGATTTTVYDAMGNTLSVTDQLGHTTSYAYDNLYRKINVTQADPDGVGPLAAPVTTYSYDPAGNLTAQTDPLGHTTRYGYDTLNRQTQVTDALEALLGAAGATTTRVYDAVGITLSMTDPLGHTTSYGYDKLYRKISVTQADPDGVGPLAAPVTMYSYDAAGNLLSQTDPLNHTTLYGYDALNRQTQVTDALGATLGAAGATTTIVYDAAGNVGSETDHLGRTTTYGYDALNRNISVAQPDPDGAGSLAAPVTTFSYDAAGNLLSQTDPLNHTTLYGYDALNRQTQVTDALGASLGAAGATTTTVYDAAGNRTLTIDPMGNMTRYTYDVLNHQIAVTDARGVSNANNPASDLEADTTHTAYDAAGNVISTTDQRDNVTLYGYDALNRQTQVTDALGSALGDTAHTTATFYDAVGNVLLVEGPLMQADNLRHGTRYAYDALNRKIQMTEARGVVINTGDPTNASGDNAAYRTTYTYDSAGNLTLTTDPLSHSTRYGYDALNRQVSVTDPRGVSNVNNPATDLEAYTTHTQYDAVGNTLALTDAQDNATTYTYDGLNRKLTETNQLSQTRNYTYDAAGNTLSLTDRDGRRTTYLYDQLNRPIVEEQYDANQVKYNRLTRNYDNDSRIVSLNDPLTITSYTYDTIGAVTQSTQEMRVVVYGGADTLVNTDPLLNGAYYKVTTFSANAGDTIRSRLWSADFDAVVCVRDANGTILASDDNSGGGSNALLTYLIPSTGTWTIIVTSHTPLATGNFVLEVDKANPGGTISTSSVYDQAGNLTQVSDNLAGGASTTTHQYDALNRRSQTDETVAGGTGGGPNRVVFNYDRAGQYSGIVRSDSFDGGSTYTVVVSSAYTYDAAGELTNLSHTANGGGWGVLANDSWTYDAAGRLVSQNLSGGSHPTDAATYSYDTADELLSADHTAQSDEAYTYDSAGNRIAKNAISNTIGTDNRLTTDGTYNYGYDAEGNLTTRTTIATGALRTLTYDNHNNLTSVIDRSSANGPLTQVVQYAYNALDERIYKLVDPDGDGAQVATVTYFTYANQQLMTEFVYSGSLFVASHRYVYAPGTDQVLADLAVNTATAVHWTLGDQEGSIRDVVAVTGLNQYSDTAIEYDSFGNVVNDQQAACHVLYAGRELDVETGYYYNRARYYDPQTGRFISQDPAGFAAGQDNYLYVLNNPMTFTDPSGLEARGIYSNPVSNGGVSAGSTVTYQTQNAPTPTTGNLAYNSALSGASSSWNYSSTTGNSGSFSSPAASYVYTPTYPNTSSYGDITDSSMLTYKPTSFGWNLGNAAPEIRDNYSSLKLPLYTPPAPAISLSDRVDAAMSNMGNLFLGSSQTSYDAGANYTYAKNVDDNVITVNSGPVATRNSIHAYFQPNNTPLSIQGCHLGRGGCEPGAGEIDPVVQRQLADAVLRIEGAAQYVGGGAEFYAGLITSEFYVGIPVMAHGYDNMQAGWKTMINGVPTQTETSKLVENATGSRTAGELTNAGLSFGGTGLPYRLRYAAQSELPSLAQTYMSTRSVVLPRGNAAERGLARTSLSESLPSLEGNIPDSVKWIQNGGRVTFHADGGITFRTAEGVSVRYSATGYPDFAGAGVVRQQVQFPYRGNYTSDLTTANRLAPLGPKLLTDTWHHVEDLQTMQEINTRLHAKFSHTGGTSIIQNH